MIRMLSAKEFDSLREDLGKVHVGRRLRFEEGGSQPCDTRMGDVEGIAGSIIITTRVLQPSVRDDDIVCLLLHPNQRFLRRGDDDILVSQQVFFCRK
jgi:hypothetical protein